MNNSELNDDLKKTILCVSVISSLVSLAWSLVVYHRYDHQLPFLKKRLFAMTTFAIFASHSNSAKRVPFSKLVKNLPEVFSISFFTLPSFSWMCFSITIQEIPNWNLNCWCSYPTCRRSLRYTYPDKKNLDWRGSIFQFLWHFSSITARVIALSLFASIHPKGIFAVCAAHWAVMAGWVVAQRTQACSNRCEEVLFSAVLGAIYIFSFFNAKDERTRYRRLTPIRKG